MSEWRKISESNRYEVNDQGEVRGPSGRVLKPTLMQIGYSSVALSLGNRRVVRRYVHVLVAEAFLGEIPEDHVVNPKNHNKLDNRLANLEVVSRSSNTAHWARKGRSSEAGRKRDGLCGRGHKLQGSRSYCLECRRMKAAGIEFFPPDDTEWRESSVAGYLVSRDGRLWSDKVKRLLRPGTNVPGYHYFNLRQDGKTKPFALHRLVAEAFLGEIGQFDVVDHINGDKLDNRVENLRITSRSDNTVAFRDRVRSEGNHRFKLEEGDVVQIKQMLAAGKLTQKEIAAAFSVGASLISDIKNGYRWAHVDIDGTTDAP